MLDSFGGRAMIARKKLGISQKEVVERLEERGVTITRAHYSKIEGNKVNPSRDVVEAMCYVLRCSSDWLMKLPDFEQPEAHRQSVGLPIDDLDDDIKQSCINMYQTMVQWNTERKTLQNRLYEIYQDNKIEHRSARSNTVVA